MAKSIPSAVWYGILKAVGFTRSYNFILFFIFAGGLFGFTLSRLEYLSMKRYSQGSAPGEWYWFHQDFYQKGLLIHLSAILPCSLLVVLQFVPIIRHKFPLFHRGNGYVIIILFLISNAGAIIITPNAFGGPLHVQFASGLLIVVSTVSVLIAYINIRRKQIEQHRAWMLRAMFYMGSIVTIRPLMEILDHILPHLNHANYVVWPCDQIEFTWNFYQIPIPYVRAYPMCNATNLLGLVPPGTPLFHTVKADSRAEDPIAVGASVQVAFGLSFWVALVLHMVGIEIYLRLTPREHQRLRLVSYKRQADKGFRHPGSAGLVVQKLGDADPWVPVAQEEGESELPLH